MSDPFIGQIKIFAGNFSPRGWASCDGQLLAISQYTALFSLLGTTYGGDGRTTFGLPDLRSRVPIQPRRGPGLSDYRLGQKGGVEQAPLNEAQLPAHNHTVNATTGISSTAVPSSSTYLARGRGVQQYKAANATAPMAANSIGDAGGSQPHNNMQPYIAMNYIIALVGFYPSRS